MAYGTSAYGSSTYGTEGLAFNTNSITYTLNGVLLKTLSKTFTLDAFIVYCTSPGGSSTTTIRYNFPITFDACLSKINTKTFSVDASLIRFINFDINSYLQKTTTLQLILDAFIVYNISRCPGAVVTSDDITTGTIYGTDGIKNW